jgi:hypothetical protein
MLSGDKADMEHFAFLPEANMTQRAPDIDRR